jgi:hypothetical protein
VRTKGIERTPRKGKNTPSLNFIMVGIEEKDLHAITTSLHVNSDRSIKLNDFEQKILKNIAYTNHT